MPKKDNILQQSVIVDKVVDMFLLAQCLGASYYPFRRQFYQTACAL